MTVTTKCVEYPDGTKCWITDCYITNNKPHRADGPAVEYPDGSTLWWVNGKRHRIDGPAIDFTEVFGKKWYVNDTEVTEDLHLFDTEEGRAFLLLKYGQP
jgi:hypothetical protein